MCPLLSRGSVAALAVVSWGVPSCSLTRTAWTLAFWWDTAFVKLGTVEYCEAVPQHCA